MPQRSAGILLYRLTDAAPKVLPVHPSGRFWAKNDDGA
jgi:predicted NUDIX family NTP pyrophosphohydrolase